MSQVPAMVDAGSVRQFANFALSAGLSLSSILDADLSAIVATASLEERVPAHGIVDLLQVCSVVANRPDLGISFAAWANLRSYGPLSLLWDHCSTLGEAIRVSQRFGHIENSGIIATLEEHGDEIALRNVLLTPTLYGGSQFLEAVLAYSMLIGRLILGNAWSPVRVEFQHAAPAHIRSHHNLFRCPLEFGADRCAVVVKRQDIDRRTGVGNAHMLAYLEAYLEATERPWPASLELQAEQIIAASLANGNASLAKVAEALRVNPRTLQRRLAALGLTFNQVVAQVRCKEAEAYFRGEARPNLTELAYRLGYGDSSAVSRFLRTNLGVGVRRWAGASVLGV